MTTNNACRWATRLSALILTVSAGFLGLAYAGSPVSLIQATPFVFNAAITGSRASNTLLCASFNVPGEQELVIEHVSGRAMSSPSRTPEFYIQADGTQYTHPSSAAGSEVAPLQLGPAVLTILPKSPIQAFGPVDRYSVDQALLLFADPGSVVKVCSPIGSLPDPSLSLQLSVTGYFHPAVGGGG